MNAEQAARLLGCSSKTVLRHIARGTITATHRHAQELEIAEDQVEKLRSILTFGKSGQVSDIVQDMSGQIEALSERVRELEEKVQTLESRLPSSHVPTSSPQAPEKTEKLYKYAVDKADVQPTQSTQKRATIASSTIPSDLPEGTLTSTQFRTQLGIEKVEMGRYIQRGVFGEPFPMTRIPHPTREGYTLTFFTPDEQERARELLKRHCKS